MIKRYKDFKINESVIEEEKAITDIFLEFTDDEFKLELKPVFFDKELFNREHLSDVYNRPGVIMRIIKRTSDEIKIDSASTILNNIDECVDRLSDLGKVSIGGIKFDRDIIDFKIYLIYEDKEVELSTKEGFYNFFDLIKTIWRNYDNKTTRTFDFKQDKDEVILTPKSEGFNTNMMLSEVKNQLKKFFVPWNQSLKFRTSHEYTYDVKVIENNIHIIYKERFQIDRFGRRVQ